MIKKTPHIHSQTEFPKYFLVIYSINRLYAHNNDDSYKLVALASEKMSIIKKKNDIYIPKYIYINFSESFLFIFSTTYGQLLRLPARGHQRHGV